MRLNLSKLIRILYKMSFFKSLHEYCIKIRVPALPVLGDLQTPCPWISIHYDASSGVASVLSACWIVHSVWLNIKQLM